MEEMFFILLPFTALIFLIFEQSSLHFNSAQALTTFVAGAVAWLS